MKARLLVVCPSAMGTFGRNAGTAPFGPAAVHHSRTAVLAGDSRQSCQQTMKFPVGSSMEIFGLNWLRTVASSFTRIGDALQVVPLLSEYFSSMSRLLLSWMISSVYMRYSRPKCGLAGLSSNTRPVSGSTDRWFCAGMKSKPPTFVVPATMAGPQPPGPRPSAST